MKYPIRITTKLEQITSINEALRKLDQEYESDKNKLLTEGEEN